MDKCPKCQSQDIDWTTMIDEEGRMGKLWWCNSCDWEKEIWDEVKGSRFVGEGLDGITIIEKEVKNGTS